MNARERVILSLGHHKPDRLPRYEIFLPGFADKWRADKKLSGESDIYDHYGKVDIGRILADQRGPFLRGSYTRETGGDTYYFRDTWGRLLKESHHGYFFEVIETAVRDKKDLDGLEFDNPNDPDRYGHLMAAEKPCRRRFAPVTGIMGLFMSSYYLRGEFALLVDLMEDPAFCSALAARVGDFLAAVGERALTATNTWDTAIWIYDELGNNKSSVMSPATFERIYLEPYRKMLVRLKSNGVANIILHCDGNCLPLLDLLLDAGFTGIQGVYPSAGMTIPAVKAKYGKCLSLIGGIDNMHLLTRGSHRDIEREIASIVEAGREGGVIIGSHSIDSDIPVENYDFYSAVLDRLDEQW